MAGDDAVPAVVEEHLKQMLTDWLRGAADRLRAEGYQAGYAAGVASTTCQSCARRSQ